MLRGSESIKQAKDCLVNGNIAEIKFKSEASKKEAKSFDFTEAQADAILAMPLSRLIGLEVLKLTSEAENLKNNIDEYNKILSDKTALDMLRVWMCQAFQRLMKRLLMSIRHRYL